MQAAMQRITAPMRPRPHLRPCQLMGPAPACQQQHWHTRGQSACSAAKRAASGKGKSSLDSLIKKKEDVQQKQEQQKMATAEQFSDPEVRALLLMAVNSYYKHTKKALIETDFAILTEAIFNAPFVLLIHNRFQDGVTDPAFIYGNRAALSLFEASWKQFVGMPSRKSAVNDAAAQQDRDAHIDAAATAGVVYNLSGVRQSLKGKLFTIKGTTLWNIEDADGELMGQAAVFTKYEKDGREMVVQGFAFDTTAAAAAAPLPVPTAEDIEAAEAAIQKWAVYIRTIKSEQGLSNKDPLVLNAVASLQRWKAELESLQERVAVELKAAAAAFDDEDDDDQEGTQDTPQALEISHQ